MKLRMLRAKLGAPTVRTFHFDQTDDASGVELASNVSSTLGPIDVLIANGGGPKPGTLFAGIARGMGPQLPVNSSQHAFAY